MREPLTTLHADGTAECECGVPLFPIAIEGDVLLECANRHRRRAIVPVEARLRRVVDSWVARKGAQLHTQHERWDGEEEA